MENVGKKLVGGAVGVLFVARDLASHAAWYLRYRVDGRARDGENAQSERRGRD